MLDNVLRAEKYRYLGNFGDLFVLPDPELFNDRGESGAGVYKPLLVIIVKSIIQIIAKLEFLLKEFLVSFYN